MYCVHSLKQRRGCKSPSKKDRKPIKGFQSPNEGMRRRRDFCQLFFFEKEYVYSKTGKDALFQAIFAINQYYAYNKT
jgi:hypothetical protein